MPRLNFGTFSVEAPGDWSLSTVIVSGPPVSDPTSKGMPTTKAVRPFQQNLILTVEQVAPGETAEAYVQKQIEGLRKANVPRKETAKPEKVALKGGHEGLLTESSVTGPAGERVRQLQLVVVRNGVAHTLIASNLDGLPYDQGRELFKKMLLSFE